MSLSRGRYGIEWNPLQTERRPSGLKWILLLVAIVAVASFTTSLVKRFRSSSEDSLVAGASPAAGEVAETPGSASAPEGAAVVQEATPEPAAEPVVQAVVKRSETEKRPTRVRILLLRLEEAERRRDVEMAASTIEQLRSLQGSPAADLDDALARRLGALNIRRLFVKKTPLWVRKVEVRRGDSATRIAAENGSTFASFKRLNGGNVETVRLGSKVYVMDHPRFVLLVHRRARTADLLLKDRFFKRYDLQHEPTAEAGSYTVEKSVSNFFRTKGISLQVADRTELELLMPVGSTVLISEM